MKKRVVILVALLCITAVMLVCFVYTPTYFKINKLNEAIRAENMHDVEQILKESDLNLNKKGGSFIASLISSECSMQTPFEAAAGCGNKEIMTTLIEYGASPEIDGENLLYWLIDAYGFEDDPEFLLYLIENGAKCDVEEGEHSPLLAAASMKPLGKTGRYDEEGSEKVLMLYKLLAAHSTDQCPRDSEDGDTPLHRAALYGNPELINYLIDEQNLSVNEKNSSGLTPLCLALKDSYDKRNLVPTVTALLEHNADITLEDKDGKNALDYAKTADASSDLGLVKMISKEAPSIKK